MSSMARDVSNEANCIDSPFKVDLDLIREKFGPGALEHSGLGVVPAGAFASPKEFLASCGRLPEDFPGRSLQMVDGEDIGLVLTHGNYPAKGFNLMISIPSAKPDNN